MVKKTLFKAAATTLASVGFAAVSGGAASAASISNTGPGSVNVVYSSSTGGYGGNQSYGGSTYNKTYNRTGSNAYWANYQRMHRHHHHKVVFKKKVFFKTADFRRCGNNNYSNYGKW